VFERGERFDLALVVNMFVAVGHNSGGNHNGEE
jgi:hypothetical protein